jgi:hypothetical protein
MGRRYENLGRQHVNVLIMPPRKLQAFDQRLDAPVHLQKRALEPRMLVQLRLSS